MLIYFFQLLLQLLSIVFSYVYLNKRNSFFFHICLLFTFLFPLHYLLLNWIIQEKIHFLCLILLLIWNQSDFIPPSIIQLFNTLQVFFFLSFHVWGSRNLFELLSYHFSTYDIYTHINIIYTCHTSPLPPRSLTFFFYLHIYKYCLFGRSSFSKSLIFDFSSYLH